MADEAMRGYSENYWRNMLLDVDPAAIVEWHLGEVRASCQDCLEMAASGRITAADFVARGIYPQSRDLECHGYNCQCFLIIVDLPSTPNIEELMGDLSEVDGVGDADLAAFYDRVHSDLVNAKAAVTPSSGWGFDTEWSFDRHNNALADHAKEMTPAASSFGFDKRPARTVGEAQWQQKASASSTITAPASSAGSFTGERFGGFASLPEEILDV